MLRLILAVALASIASGTVYSHEPPAGSAAQRGTPQAPDPLASAECQLARRQLDVVLSTATESRHENAAELERARQRTAVACLGQADSTGIRAPQPVIVVPPTVTAAPPPPLIVAPPPPVTVPRLSVITFCDPGGCWDSDGTRLHRAGPNLMGPHGLCTVQGNVLSCQ
jgi:hypothetical protein